MLIQQWELRHWKADSEYFWNVGPKEMRLRKSWINKIKKGQKVLNLTFSVTMLIRSHSSTPWRNKTFKRPSEGHMKFVAVQGLYLWCFSGPLCCGLDSSHISLCTYQCAPWPAWAPCALPLSLERTWAHPEMSVLGRAASDNWLHQEKPWVSLDTSPHGEGVTDIPDLRLWPP